MQMLVHEYGSSEALPHAINGRIVELEEMAQSEKYRKKYKFLGHLPITCNFQVVELDMSSIVSPRTLEAFSEELQKQEARRKKKQQLEQQRLKEKMREEKAQLELERQRVEERNSMANMLANTDIFPPNEEYSVEYFDDEFLESTDESDRSVTPPLPPPTTISPISKSPVHDDPKIPKITSLPPPKLTWANLVTGTPSDPFFQTPIYAPNTTSTTNSTTAKPTFADALKNKKENPENSNPISSLATPSTQFSDSIFVDALKNTRENSTTPPSVKISEKPAQKPTTGKKKKKEKLVLLSNSGSRSYR